MNRLIALVLFSVISIPYFGQVSPLGIPIQFQSGSWKIVNDDFGSCVLGHDVLSGPIFILEHGHRTMDQLQNEFESGYSDETMTLFSSSPSVVSGNRISISLTGTAQGTPLKAEAIGILSEKNSFKGIVIMTVTMESEDNTKQLEAINSIANSLVYVSPNPSQVWMNKLSGYELVSRSSYSTSSSSPDGSYYTSSSSSSTTKFIFCSNGNFNYISSSYTSVSGSGLDSKSDDSKDMERGEWSAITVGQNNVVKMIYADGTVVYLPISRENGVYYMADDQYTKGPNDTCE